MTDLEALRRDYRVALLRFLARRDEVASTAGYEIGRACFTGGVALLELVEIHEELVSEILQDTHADERLQVVRAAADFLLEVLSTFDMTQRGLFDE
jgi:hypothetical protein